MLNKYYEEMQTKKTMGRPRGVEKVLFRQRVVPEMVSKIRAFIAGRPVGLTEIRHESSDLIIRLAKKNEIPCPSVEWELAESKKYGSAMSTEVDRLTLENENLQFRVMELQAGLTDTYVRYLRALVQKQQVEIARLS